MKDQIIHTCHDGQKEYVQDKIDCGFIFCPFCGQPYIPESIEERFQPLKIVCDVKEEKGCLNCVAKNDCFLSERK